MRGKSLVIFGLALLAACTREEEPVANRFDRNVGEIENKARALEASVENQVGAIEAQMQNEIDALDDQANQSSTADGNMVNASASR